MISTLKKKDKAVKSGLPITKALFRAVRDADTTAVRMLIRKRKAGVNVLEEDDPEENTPLLLACKEQQLGIVEWLLKAKPPADVNAENKQGHRPIWWAVKHGSSELAELLIRGSDQKCDVNYIDPESGCTPLYRAILTNNADVCGHIIHAGANVNLRRLGLQGETAAAQSPLVKSVQLNNLRICEMLVNSLCDIHARTSDGFTALHFSVAYCRYDICEFLLSEKIKVNAKSHKGITAMTVAIARHLPAMCRLLIEFGYRMNGRFSWGETCLEMAIRYHSQYCAMTLIHWGCSVTRKSSVSYFTLAANEGLTELIKFLAELYPHFLGEEWVRQKQPPLALYRVPEFYTWLFQLAESPRSLQVLCRAKIFRYLGKYPCNKVDKIPLPPSLKEPLFFKQYFPDKVYFHKTLDKGECPFDCLSSCMNEQCPRLDFSDSASDEI